MLNKTDLVSAAELQEVKEELLSINAFAELIETVQSVVDLDRVLGVNSFSVEKTLEVDPAFLQADPPAEPEPCSDVTCTDHGHAHSHGHAHGHEAKKPKTEPKPLKKRHDLSGVSSVGITCVGELDFNVLNGFMMRLLQTSARDLFRSKGVMCFQGQGDAKFVFQGVHEQVHFGPSQSVWAPGEVRLNKMVFIGRNLNREELEKGFKACLAAPKK